MRNTKAFISQVDQLGPRSIRVTCSTGAVDRDGEVVDQGGIDLSEFRQNPVVLWSHNPEHPVGNAADTAVIGGKLQSRVDFFPEGVSKKADEICALYKGGFVKTVSIGFDPINTEPMDPARPRGPQRYLNIRLFEISLVTLPANSQAEVVQRAWKEGRTISAATGEKIGRARAAAVQCIGHLDNLTGDAAPVDQDEAKARRLRIAHALGLKHGPAPAASVAAPSRPVPATKAERIARAQELAPYPGHPEASRLMAAAYALGRTLSAGQVEHLIKAARQANQDPAFYLRNRVAHDPCAYL